MKAVADVDTLFSQLLAANEGAAELLMNAGQLHHNIIHPLAKSERVVKKVRTGLRNAKHLVDKRLDVRRVDIERGGS